MRVTGSVANSKQRPQESVSASSLSKPLRAASGLLVVALLNHSLVERSSSLLGDRYTSASAAHADIISTVGVGSSVGRSSFIIMSAIDTHNNERRRRTKID